MHPDERALHPDGRLGNLDQRSFQVDTDELQMIPSPDATGVLS
jgi:hypothetical protein